MMQTTQPRNAVMLIALLLLLVCCHSPKGEREKDAAAETAFTPDPQEVPEQEVKILDIGDEAPHFRLPDVSGKFYSLADFETAKILVIIFTCNHCPTAQAYEDRMIQFTKDYREKGVQVVGIMPNSVLGLLPEEGGYTDLNDSYEEMIIRAKDKGYNFPYLYDGDDQKVSLQYGPATTPHAFVFDSERKLQYVGRLDGSEKPGTANAEDLRAAVDALLRSDQVATPVHKAFGCSVKWGWKNEYAKKVAKEITERPVELKKADVHTISALVKNAAPSEKLRLINVWATWCAPCVAEFPDLLLLQRMYGQRNFEFISLSADEPSNHDKALAFLKKKYSFIDNYIYDGTDKYALIEAVDPEWNGALPYTLLVEPGGNVIYRYQGVVDQLELRKTIVEHPMMGRYY